MFLYYIIITVIYLIYVILFAKNYEKLEDENFELLNENFDLRLENIDLQIEKIVLMEELNKYEG